MTIPAKDKIGHILFNMATGKPFFRIYDDHDKSKFIDYDMKISDMEVKILDEDATLYHTDTPYIDHSEETLGIAPEPPKFCTSCGSQIMFNWGHHYCPNETCDIDIVGC